MISFFLFFLYLLIWGMCIGYAGMWGLFLGWIVPEVLFRLIGEFYY